MKVIQFILAFLMVFLMVPINSDAYATLMGNFHGFVNNPYYILIAVGIIGVFGIIRRNENGKDINF